MNIDTEDEFVVTYHLKHGYKVVTTALGYNPEDVAYINPGDNDIEGANGLFYNFNSEDVILISAERM